MTSHYSTPSHVLYITIEEIQFYGRAAANPTLQTIHSAANDTIYYLDGQTPVTVAVTDANGVGEIDLENLGVGAHTLYSTVAKNPTNLSNPYSKTINVTRYTTEVYLMPLLGMIYWYGYKSNNCEAIISANGWSVSGGYYGLVDPTFNTTNVTGARSGNNYCGLIGTKNTISCSRVKSILNPASNSTSVIYIGATNNNKVCDESAGYLELPTAGLRLITFTPSDLTDIRIYFTVRSTVALTVSALWYE